MIAWLSSLLCRHEYWRTVERFNYGLKCAKCGKLTEGWAIEPTEATRHLWRTQ